MAVFRYTATSAAAAGGPQRGELTADTAYQVRLAIRRMGLTPLRIREVAPRGVGLHPRVRALAARLARKRRNTQLAELYESLAALLATGTPLGAALRLLADGGGPRGGRTMCRQLAESVSQGSSLADALAARTDWFGPVDVALVGAAEQSGDLEAALADLADYHGRADELKGRLAMALAYPTLLAVFGIAVVIFLTTTTLPQVAGALADAGAALPRTTQVLLAVGHTLTDHWLLLLPAAGALVAGAVWLARTPRLATARLRVPFVGRLTARAQLSSAALLLSRLLRGGITLTDALRLAAPTMGNSALRGALLSLESAVKEGRDASEALADSALFEPVFRQVVAVGEASGELPEALATIGARYRESSRRLVDRLAAALEPSVILLLAGLIGFVVYAALAPMLALTRSL